jgi:hypothetical protein
MDWDPRDFTHLPRRAQHIVLRMVNTTFLDWEAEAYYDVLASAYLYRLSAGWFTFSEELRASSVRAVQRPPRDTADIAAAARRISF